MNRYDFLKRVLTIPAIAMLFPASTGAVAEPKLTNQATSTGYISKDPSIAVYVSKDRDNNSCFDIPFEQSTFSVNDIIAYDSSKEQLWVKETWQHEKPGITVHRCFPLVEQPEPLFTVVASGSLYKSIGSMQTSW